MNRFLKKDSTLYLCAKYDYQTLINSYRDWLSEGLLMNELRQEYPNWGNEWVKDYPSWNEDLKRDLIEGFEDRGVF